MDLLLYLFSEKIEVLIWHICIGILFAVIILTVNYLIPYQLKTKPSDIGRRRIIFFSSILVIGIVVWLFDAFYLNDFILNSTGIEGAELEEERENLSNLIAVNIITSIFLYFVIYFCVASYMKTSNGNYKCYSVFKM